MNDIVTVTLDCGMPLIVQPIPNVASAAITWRLPAGSATDPADADGCAAMLAEIIFRGAAAYSSREHSDALDRLGVQRTSRTHIHHLELQATMINSRLAEALPLLVMMITQPRIPEDALQPVRSLCLQSLESLDDDPQHLVMLRLRQHHKTPPFNRHGYGERSVLQRLSIEQIREAHRARFRPGGAIFAAAGAVDPETLTAQLNELLRGFDGTGPSPDPAGQPARGFWRIEQDTAQVHIGLACDAPPEAGDNAMLERLAVAVLSGSTSGRLFSEVRQKRSLCYSVGASYRSDRRDGMMMLYAGTTPQRAQETLDVCLQEVHRLRDGVTADEFHRAAVGLKSRLIMEGESTPARAAALARDYFRLGRARTLDEIADAIDAITLDELNAYLARRHFGPFTGVTIGPVELHAPATAGLAHAN